VSEGILTAYVERAMERAVVEQVGVGKWHAEIPECDGVWAVADGAADVRKALKEVLEEWMVIRLQRGHGLPPVGGVAVEPVSSVSDPLD